MNTSVNLKTLAGSLKPGVELIPPIALWAAITAARTHGIKFCEIGMFNANLAHRNGADKYGEWNWREIAIEASVYYSAIIRHLCKLRGGERFDTDSKLHHLAHVIANANILIDAEFAGSLIDDRPFICDLVDGRILDVDTSFVECLEDTVDVIECFISRWYCGESSVDALGAVIAYASKFLDKCESFDDFLKRNSKSV